MPAVVVGIWQLIILPFTNHTQPKRKIGFFLNPAFYPLFPSLTATRPRRQISYNLEPLGINAPLGEVLEQKDPFALYHTNRKLTLEPKVNKEEDNNPSSLIPSSSPSSPIVRQVKTTIVIGSTTELLYIRDDLHIDLFQSIIKYQYKQHNTIG